MLLMNGKRVGLYLRVSTKGNGQDVENQRLALAAACEARGWHIAAE
jgi:DNA invertase Pin-like site-specific DNA recombinase